ncbi:hypothetical protein GCM10023172_09210 [Hymenobacter ginsengisoli]|uniref:Uncharacterized protein n=1 Tax=Hymenobacter ginsengisoli TaxID=1051626 RepID=A0ABP8Q4S3_9BACT
MADGQASGAFYFGLNFLGLGRRGAEQRQPQQEHRDFFHAEEWEKKSGKWEYYALVRSKGGLGKGRPEGNNGLCKRLHFFASTTLRRCGRG